jgi:hypothetical protein
MVHENIRNVDETDDANLYIGYSLVMKQSTYLKYITPGSNKLISGVVYSEGRDANHHAT